MPVSVGDYVLSGGEIGALVLLDACVRLLPGVMGAASSGEEESFESGLLEYPHYTRPVIWEGRRIPEVLRSGDHARIAAWRKAKAAADTRSRRPDLVERHRGRAKATALWRAARRRERREMNLIQQLEAEAIEQFAKSRPIPEFRPGDTLRVGVKVVEGERTRVQNFEGVCIARANRGLGSSFTVRKISFGEGVERVFPLYSPNIETIEVVRRGAVRRAKLYYLRGRTGKAARIAERRDTRPRQAAARAAKAAATPRPRPPRAEPSGAGDSRRAGGRTLFPPVVPAFAGATARLEPHLAHRDLVSGIYCGWAVSGRVRDQGCALRRQAAAACRRRWLRPAPCRRSSKVICRPSQLRPWQREDRRVLRAALAETAVRAARRRRPEARALGPDEPTVSSRHAQPEA